MTELNCENVCLAVMATMDGVRSPLPNEVIENHLASCSGCLAEVKELKELARVLAAQGRRQHGADVWPMISERIADLADSEPLQAGKASGAAARAFVILGVMLISYKFAEMIPEADLGLLFKLVPVLLVLAVFGYLKENPFKLNASLRLEGE
jgi:hypothetical protein